MAFPQGISSQRLQMERDSAMKLLPRIKSKWIVLPVRSSRE